MLDIVLIALFVPGFLFLIWIMIRIAIGFQKDTIETERKLQHHCANCGYDLKGNISGICPECGTKIP